MIAALTRRAAHRAAWYVQIGVGRSRFAWRARMAAAGLAPRRDYLRLDCPDGDEASGLFSEAAAVVGCLAHYENHPLVYSGMCVDFGEHGLYYEAAKGRNWWTYYFEPVSLGSGIGARMRVPSLWEHDAFAETVELRMPRATAAGIVARHLRPTPSLLDRLDGYWRERVGSARVLGVHYRGTDKWEGAPVVSYDAVAAAARDVQRAAGGGPWKIFLATDDAACVDYMAASFPQQVFSLEMQRSHDGRPLHKRSGDGFRKGDNAVMDCLLLSRSTHLIRTDSNLGLFATLFNPLLGVTMLNRCT